MVKDSREQSARVAQMEQEARRAEERHAADLAEKDAELQAQIRRNQHQQAAKDATAQVRPFSYFNLRVFFFSRACYLSYPLIAYLCTVSQHWTSL
jgi:hypothetical protein